MKSVRGSLSSSGRLFRKYALVMAFLVGGSLLVSGTLELVLLYRDSSDGLSRVQREKASNAATRISQFVSETEHQIAWTIRPAGATLEQREDDYLRLLRLAPAFTDVRYIDRSGREAMFVSRVALNTWGAGTDYSSFESFVKASLGEVYFSPVYYRDESEPYMTIAVPENTPDGGMTIADINLKFIWDVISQVSVGTRGYAYVVDNTGQLIAHRDISRVLRRSDYSQLSQIQLAFSGTEPRFSSLHARGGATLASDPNGGPVLTAYEVIPLLEWRVFVEQPLDEAFAPVLASLSWTTLLMLLGLALSIVASLVLARHMTNPIRALQEAATSLGDGELGHRIEVQQTGDELESLGHAFNTMADQLAGAYADLERKVSERTQELATAMRDLRVASQHKSDFLAMMSHELRTPLNAVIGFADMVRMEMVGPLNDRQRDYLNDVVISGRHLLSLINDLLDLSKIEAGKIALERDSFWLPDVVDQGLTVIREAAACRHLHLEKHIDASVGEIQGDERRIKQVLINLLANAVKFTPDDGWITVAARRVEDAVVVSVQDTGIGVPEAERGRIFEAFEQGTARTEGTGLGLALARRFVELHGGRIWAESHPGQGSTFAFTVPSPAQSALQRA